MLNRRPAGVQGFQSRTTVCRMLSASPSICWVTSGLFRNDQGALTGPGGGACPAEPGQVNGVVSFESLSHPEQRAVRSRCHPHEAEAALFGSIQQSLGGHSIWTVSGHRMRQCPILNRRIPHPSHSTSTLCKSVAARSSRRSTQQLARCGFSKMALSSLVTSRLVKPAAPCVRQVVMSTRRWLLCVGPVTGSLLASTTDMSLIKRVRHPNTISNSCFGCSRGALITHPCTSDNHRHVCERAERA